jgi:hypothetical protein
MIDQIELGCEFFEKLTAIDVAITARVAGGAVGDGRFDLDVIRVEAGELPACPREIIVPGFLERVIMARSRTGEAISPGRRTAPAQKKLGEFVAAADARGALDAWRRGRAMLASQSTRHRTTLCRLPRPHPLWSRALAPKISPESPRRELRAHRTFSRGLAGARQR